MIVVNSTENETRKKSLIDTYRKTPELGLVLGAGVTVDSKVPGYPDLVLRLLKIASDTGKLTVPQDWVDSFVQQQRELLGKKDRKTVPPEEVALFVFTRLGYDHDLLRHLVNQALYPEDCPVGKTVKSKAFEKNPTLDSILTFCAARPGTVLAPVYSKNESTTNTSKTETKRYEIEANNKVGAILTTNYDNLLEGAFHTKYRRKLLKPVGRPGSRESAQDRRLIPVYHIHGYLDYRQSKPGDMQAENPEIVITESDYFKVFYDPLGFGNYIAMSFLRRFPCLFIGSAMTDKNLRRFLFHLAQSVRKEIPHQRKFAILKTQGTSEDDLTEAILHFYGVETIWVKEYDEIGWILRDMYTAVKGVAQSDWDYVANFKW